MLRSEPLRLTPIIINLDASCIEQVANTVSLSGVEMNNKNELSVVNL